MDRIQTSEIKTFKEYCWIIWKKFNLRELKILKVNWISVLDFFQTDLSDRQDIPNSLIDFIYESPLKQVSTRNFAFFRWRSSSKIFYIFNRYVRPPNTKLTESV